LGNLPHKFVWYNRKPDEFAQLTKGRRVGVSSTRGRWLFAPLEPGYVLVLGECGGKVLYHPPGVELPDRFHLCLIFEDGSALTATTQMWGAIAHDILFRAHLLPQHPIGDLTKRQKRQLFNAIVKTVDRVIQKGGRYDECDLYGKPGKYMRLMDKNAVERPCPGCGGKVKKIQYLGGACYFCPSCQK
jgi:formamidopyrimidine-DNA glycosylase